MRATPHTGFEPVHAVCALLSGLTVANWIAGGWRPSRSRRNSASGGASDTVSAHGDSDDAARRLATGRSLTGALRRVLLLPVRSPGRAGGGGVIVAVFWQPTQAVTPPSPSPCKGHLLGARLRMVPW